jgi:hypothetical protein
MSVYRYVGPKDIADRVRSEHRGTPIRSADDVLAWIRATEQQLSDSCVVATFVVDTDGVLRIADRRSEHVACAGGQPVLSAGEMTFSVAGQVEVVEASNQSTGYCPEPESWSDVGQALARAGLRGPSRFTLECVFRRCGQCGSITLIKNELFRCGICNAALPQEYNIQR